MAVDFSAKHMAEERSVRYFLTPRTMRSNRNSMQIPISYTYFCGRGWRNVKRPDS